MELTKSTSFPLLPSTENNAITDSPDLNTTNPIPKPFFKMFSINRNFKQIDSLVMDETDEFLENLIELRNSNKKDPLEIDYEFHFKGSTNPFEKVDEIYNQEYFYKSKYNVVDHHNELLTKKESINSQEESKPELIKQVEIVEKANKINKQYMKAKEFKDEVDDICDFKI